MKYLMWLPILLTPALVFWATPKTPPAWRIGRLLAAVALLYMTLNVVLILQSRLEWQEIYAFRDQNPDCRLQHCDGERKPSVRGPNVAFALVLGWIPALFYVGLLELAWRVWHWKQIKLLKKRDYGIIFSSIFIVSSVSISILIDLEMIYSIGFQHGSFTLFKDFYYTIRILLR